MAEDEREDSPQDEEANLAASGAAGEPADADAGDDAAAQADDAAPAESGAEQPTEPADTAAEPTGEAEAVAPDPAATGAEGAQPPGGEPTADEAGAEGVDPPSSAAAPDESPTAGEEDPAPAPAPAAERPAPESGGEEKKPDVVPGAHLEPDLVLESDRRDDDDEFARYSDDGEQPTGEDGAPATEAPAAPKSTIDLAAGARYKATGKRKTAVARVIVRPGSGSYQINGRTLEAYFPRPTLQKTARQPLEAAGYDTRMDVVARIHGGGVSSQADALRHGVARALVEADPNLRTELKRRGYLTRDAREKERKKAGLKKARKRPQFSKR